MEFGGQGAGPVVENVQHGHAVHDRKGQVQVGPPIPLMEGEGADDRSGDDARIDLRQREHTIAHAVAVFDTEQGHGCHPVTGSKRPPRSPIQTRADFLRAWERNLAEHCTPAARPAARGMRLDIERRPRGMRLASGHRGGQPCAGSRREACNTSLRGT